MLVVMFDTHAHVNFNAFKDDAEIVIKRALEQGVAMINVGSQASTSERAVKMAAQYDQVYAAVGLHPMHLENVEIKEEGITFQSRQEEFNADFYKELVGRGKVVAIGETGLDYYHLDLNSSESVDIIAKQKKVFQYHLELANEVNLPLIVHCRGSKLNSAEAYKDILAELKARPVNRGGVMHCYGGPVELIKDFVALGFCFGFNGIITFDKTGAMAEILKNTPDDRILAETDCPLLTPVPHRGKRNEPAYVDFVIKKIAEVKGWDFERAVAITDKNAKSLFNV